MKREEIKKIMPQITDEELSKVMQLHGGSVNRYKESIETLKADIASMEEGIRERDEKISTFGEIDLEKLKSEEFERAYGEAKKEFEDYKRERAIDEFIKEAGARNITAVRSLLSMDKVEFESDELSGLREQIEVISKENPYLFETDNANKPSFTSNFEGGENIITKDAFKKLGYQERLRLFNDNPELYKEMNN